MIFEVGRVCVKLAGRDADQKCVVVDIIDDNFVIIDGLTRRRKCNVNHLEPLDEVVKMKKGAEHKEVVSVFKKMGIELVDKKPKKAAEKPKKVRKTKVVVGKKPAPKAKEVVKKKAEAIEESSPSKTKKVKTEPVKTEEKAPVKKTTAKPATKKE